MSNANNINKELLESVIKLMKAEKFPKEHFALLERSAKDMQYTDGQKLIYYTTALTVFTTGKLHGIQQARKAVGL